MQLNLLSKNELRYVKSWSHGGNSFKKRRKTKRPLVPGKTVHVVFKLAKSPNLQRRLNFYKNKILVDRLLKERAKKYYVIIHDYVNMGNHLHLKVRFRDAERFQNFMRTFAAMLARKVTGACRGRQFGKFWDGLVFTRVLHSPLEEVGLCGYFEGNHRERELGYEAREEFLNNWNKFIRKLKTVRAKSIESS